MKRRDLHKWAYHRKQKEDYPLLDKVLSAILLLIIAGAVIFFLITALYSGYSQD